MNDFSLSLLENIQLLLMSSSKETASELDTFFMEKLLLFKIKQYVLIHLLQVSHNKHKGSNNLLRYQHH